MHRLEPCKNTQKSLDNSTVHGAVLGGAVRMAPAGSNWPVSGGLWTGSSLAQPGPSWTSPGTPATWTAPGPSTAGAPWPTGTATAASPSPNQQWAGPSVVWQGAATVNVNTVAPPATDGLRKSRPFNIHQRLREIYMEEHRSGRVAAPLLRNLKRGSRLLEKLVERDNLNTLIVNLYAGNKGYSLSMRLQGKQPSAAPGSRNPVAEPVVETMQWPYSDDDLLQSLDREELPTTLVDVLEGTQSKLFYQGCIIAEVRDYRHTFPHTSYETHHVLLKPTTQSIINDVNMLSIEHDLSAEERLALESQIVQATAPPLCLDPNPAVGMLLNNIQGKKHRWSTAPLRRTARKFSQVTVNRKRKLDQFTSHDSLHLFDFIVKKRAKANQGKPRKMDGTLPAPPPVPRDDPLPLAPPLTEPDVFKYARAYEKPEATNDCTCTVVEEYILETERTPGVTYLIRLSVLQRLSSLEYLGQLYVDKDYNGEGTSNGSACRFVLGSLENAQRYIKQFREIFTEEGRKSVRITHLKPGQRDQVTYTPSNGERQQHVALQNVELPKLPNNLPQQMMAGTIPTNNLSKPSAVPSVSQLTHLLKSATVPPNVNVHQIQQGGSTIQSILSGALTAGVLTSDTLSNGSSLLNASNATVHYQPVATQQAPSSSKPSRPVLNSNPQIAALATSLRNSVEQFEMQVASQAQAQAQAQVQVACAVPTSVAASSQNPTILSLLNAGPALPSTAASKLVARKTAARIQNLPNNVNKTLLVNNNQHLRVTLSSFPNQLVGQTAQSQSGQPQQGFTLVTTQAQTQPQTYSLSSLGQSQGFTISPAQNSQTFTVLQPNQNFTLPSVQSQTFQINPSGTTGQTFTITTPVVTVSSQFPTQTAPPSQVFTVNIPQTSGTGGKGKSFTIQATPQSFAKQAVQRRLSTTFQQQSELTKLLGDRGDSRVMTERHIGDKDSVKMDDVRSGSSLGLSMPGLSALLANTPSADNPIPGGSSSTSSTLLERLSTPTAASFTSPPSFPPPSPAPSPSQNLHNSAYLGSPTHAFNSHSPLPSLTSPSLPFASPSPKSQVQLQGASPSSNSPLSSPPQATPVVNLQGLSFQGLSSLPSALQLSIPGIAVPISLSLNVSGQGQGVLMTSLPATTTATTAADATMVLTNSAGSGGQISVAQLMSTSKSSARPQASISMPQGTGQSIQLVSALQRPNSRTNVSQMQIQGNKNTPIASRGVADHRQTVKVATNAAGGAQIAAGSQIMALSPQQFQLLQKHGLQGLSLSASCLAPQKNTISAASINNKHRRRSSAADPNK